MKRILTNFLLAIALVSGLNYTAHPDKVNLRELLLGPHSTAYLSPTALVANREGDQVYLACDTANQVAVYDVASREILKRIDLPSNPTGLALSADGQQLYVSCAAVKSRICVIETRTGRLRTLLRCGHSATAPVLSPDGSTLYVCDRFDDAVEAFDLKSSKRLAHIAVEREPVAAALSPDGRLLFVANHLQGGRADRGVVAASVSVIDTQTHKLIKNIPLTNGSSLLQGLCVSPDGKYVAVTHTLARFHLPTTTVAHGWMNDNALSLIDANDLTLVTTVLLDEDNRGAANPWAIQWSSDGNLICVTHAGTHEVSLIDAPGLLAKVQGLPIRLDSTMTPNVSTRSAQVRADIPNDFDFLQGLRTRVKLHGKGPRCLSIVGPRIFVANYFSDSLSILRLDRQACSSATIALDAPTEIVPQRKGESYFNDATLCYQGWQSCASCHSSDARVDGMNWDLLNDGMGNPKNVKSLLLSFQTPPVMSMGVRSDAAAAIRAGLKHILFTTPREEVANAIEEYIKGLQPIPSPHLVHNRLSASAERGEKLFFSADVGCATCHPPPLFTDLKPHAVGTGKFDQRTDEFYTPTLIELWRTAPYLHDGSAASVREAVLNHADRRGHASKLTSAQVDDLAAFLLSL